MWEVISPGAEEGVGGQAGQKEVGSGSRGVKAQTRHGTMAVSLGPAVRSAATSSDLRPQFPGL